MIRSEALRVKFQHLMAPKKMRKSPKKMNVLKRKSKQQSNKFVSRYKNIYQCSRGGRLETRFTMDVTKYRALADTEEQLLEFMRSKGCLILDCMCACAFDF